MMNEQDAREAQELADAMNAVIQTEGDYIDACEPIGDRDDAQALADSMNAR